METLYHPELDRTVSVAPSLARKLRKRGWVDQDRWDYIQAHGHEPSAGALSLRDVRRSEGLPDVMHPCDAEGCGRTFGTARGLATHARIHREPTD